MAQQGEEYPFNGWNMSNVSAYYIYLLKHAAGLEAELSWVGLNPTFRVWLPCWHRIDWFLQSVV